MALSLSSTYYSPPFSSLRILHSHSFPRFLPHFTPNKPHFNLSCSCSETTSTISTHANSLQFFDSEGYSDQEYDDDRDPNPPPPPTTSSSGGSPPPMLKKRKRYRKEYPGESKGITEEMRFVAMKLRNDNGSKKFGQGSGGPSDEQRVDGGDDGGTSVQSWEPSLDGFLKYLVDSKVVFETIERIVEDSNDVSYAYFRKTGLERSGNLARDLEWFSLQNVTIPEPTNAGVSYSAYLKELSEKSGPLFLCHFYNMYFSHIAGGQAIGKQVADKLFDGRELDFYRWDGDAQELLKDVRENLNQLGEHWSRDDKNKCLKEATKSFRYLGQIVRLIIL